MHLSMKIKFLLILFLLTGSLGFAQNTMQLMSNIKKLYTANYEMDFETIVSLSYPRIVETLGKEKLLSELDNCFQNEEYRYRYQLAMVPFITHETQKIGTRTFCIIGCRNPVRYFFEKKLSAEEVATKTTWLQGYNQTKDVKFEPKRNSFSVRRTTTFLAIMDETTEGQWKFINLDDVNQVATIQSFFDENTKKQLGLSK
jgi:uncharacterized phage-like protein YoqJ